MEEQEKYYPCQVVFSETGPAFEEVVMELLLTEERKEAEAWVLPK